MFPPTCAGCNRTGFKWCPDCAKKLHLIIKPVCQICGRPIGKDGVCSLCLVNPPAYKSMRSWAIYEGPLRNALLKLKYLRNITIGDELAQQVMPVLESYHWLIDCVVPIPLGKKRKEERGYNQVGMIAFSLAALAKWEYMPGALIRTRETVSQVGLSSPERKENVRDAFGCQSCVVIGKTLLLVDDITTTGATMQEGAKALLAGGAKEVYGFTIARADNYY